MKGAKCEEGKEYFLFYIFHFYFFTVVQNGTPAEK